MVLNGRDFTPQGTLTISGDIFGSHNLGEGHLVRYWHLLGRGMDTAK